MQLQSFAWQILQQIRPSQQAVVKPEHPNSTRCRPDRRHSKGEPRPGCLKGAWIFPAEDLDLGDEAAQIRGCGSGLVSGP
jgi:hypothetical protein